MKGVIFTELLDMVESQMGIEMVDTIIEEAKLESEGAYTSVGTYPTWEIEALIERLTYHTGHSREVLLEVFGQFLFGRLAAHYPHFFPEKVDFFDFMASIHDYIHLEVQKLYPDAELPELHVQEKDDESISLLYESSRKMARLARGLIKGCMEHFGINGTIEEELLSNDGSKVAFRIKKA